MREPTKKTIPAMELERRFPRLRAVRFVGRDRATPVERYEFEVLNGDGTIAMHRSHGEGSKALWSQIEELAEDYDPGCRIRVTDPSGEMVVLAGVDTAGRAVLLR
jgi:hypothetical protein